MTTSTGTADDRSVEALVAQLMLHSSQKTQHVLNTLTEAYRTDAEAARGELARVRRDVEALIGGDQMPTPRAIYNALYGLGGGDLA